MRREAVVLFGVLVLIFLAVASWPYLSYKIQNPTTTMTGNSIKEAIGNFYETSSIGKRVFILSQIFLLIIIILVVIIVFGKLKPKVKLSKDDFLKDNKIKRSQTDLDILYAILKKKKEIGMEEIEEAFKITPEVAIGWYKVLENGNLAEIDYPRFGKPILRLPAAEQKNEIGKEQPKDKNIKDKKILLEKEVNKKIFKKRFKKKIITTNKKQHSKSQSYKNKKQSPKSKNSKKKKRVSKR